ncbi:FAD-binding protein [Rhizobium lusitanum]|uniref:FAD-binding protein n=1 Tax=Rhizobium lusitanum TaxID=293958 RepID=A0A6L9UJE9_9HYPH|nr:FAD-binding oxidoreductase [Rhizobium lusitanum]NEI74020.1 FAD-binding protein [Rhizobium lusitanum]
MTIEEIRPALEAIVGAAHVLSSPDGPRLVVRPGTTDEVSGCLAFANRHSIPVVTLGGLTGLVRGTELFGNVVGISTERLNGVLDFDPLRRQVTVGAGIKLEEVHRFAERHDLRYGVNFGARGSCSIGGNIATNAGGNSVLRFGMTRANIAGLEAVLADGRVLSDLGGLVKNNTGYDLKQLFIGSEGSLGIITKAVLKLSRPSVDTASVLLALDSLDDALAVMSVLELKCGVSLLAMEIMWNRYFKTAGALALRGSPLPLADHHPLYILAQVEGAGNGPSAEDLVLGALEGIDFIPDSALASSQAQQEAFWSIRDGSEYIEASHPTVLSFDVSMRPQDYSTYVAGVEDALSRRLPEAISYYFGHLADGNVHFMIAHDNSIDHADEIIEACVYETLSVYWPSSVSAEHGIGLEKAEHLWRSRSEEEIAVMNAVRKTFDPNGILNPHIQYRSRLD